MFGAVNALFTGLAFAGVIFTIMLQKTELSLQRKELRETRSELRGQKDLLAAQNRHVELQNFEGTFFQMMRLHYELLASIDINIGRPSEPNVLTGRDVFEQIWKDAGFRNRINELGAEERLHIVREKYKKVQVTYGSDLDHYFRSLYNIIKFVHKSEVDDKKTYTNVVRAQLSGQEIASPNVQYHCLSGIEVEGVDRTLRVAKTRS